jgi:putative Ca2+/H+ antiporter (TMEM165/GDT1 family)
MKIFVSGILAMRYNKLTVFLGAISSLVLMTVVSALLGYGVTSLIPKIYTFYASVVIMFIFGFKVSKKILVTHIIRKSL